MATTFTGRLITPHNFAVPAPLDLAVQLGRLPRFVGATRQWWTVLHHIRAMCELSEKLNGLRAPGLVLPILLHEADEVACGDIPTTWKHPEQRTYAKRLFSRVWGEYAGDAEFPEEAVKDLDLLCLRAEAAVVGPPNVLEQSGLAWGEPVGPRLDTAVKVVQQLARVSSDPFGSASPDGWMVEWFLRTLQDAMPRWNWVNVTTPSVLQYNEPWKEDTTPA